MTGVLSVENSGRLFRYNRRPELRTIEIKDRLQQKRAVSKNHDKTPSQVRVDSFQALRVA